MKRVGIVLAIGLAAAGGWWAVAQLATGNPPLTDYLPAGAVLALEARDFSALVRDWNGSSEKALWLKSANYQAFSRSRLFARLAEAQGEYAAAAGFPASMPVLESIAGTRSALGIYDIGKLEFLYISKLETARVMAGALGKSQGAYSSRKAAGSDYFVHIDPASKRVAAFAITNGLLLLATREDLIAGALALMAGRTSPSLKQEPWFDRAVKTAGAAGEIRMAGNLEALTHRPHFQSYWVQRNITELRQYESFVSDLDRSAGEMRERRVLVRANPQPAPAGGLGPLLSMVPPEASVYQAWSQPEVETVAKLIRNKVLEPRPDSSASNPAQAPAAPITPGEPGSAADLETRLDEPPPSFASQELDTTGLNKVLGANRPQTILLAESSAPLSDGVFVSNRCAIAVTAAANWDIDAVRDAITQAVGDSYSTSRLGANWRNSELEGLLKISVASRGNLLILANDAAFLQAVFARAATPGNEPATYAAGYRHARELPNYTRLMRLIDEPQRDPQADPQNREPWFFSENLASLGRALGRLQSATLAARDDGATRTETVVYRLAR